MGTAKVLGRQKPSPSLLAVINYHGPLQKSLSSSGCSHLDQKEHEICDQIVLYFQQSLHSWCGMVEMPSAIPLPSPPCMARQSWTPLSHPGGLKSQILELPVAMEAQLSQGAELGHQQAGLQNPQALGCAQQKHRRIIIVIIQAF